MFKHLGLCTFATAFLCGSAGSTALESVSLSPVSALRQLQPALSDKRARSLAKAFVSVAAEKTCQVPWQILVAIAFNESSLGVRNVNAKSKDYGMMQINEKNILRYGLSRDKLMRDEAYSIRFACKLLKDNQERYADRHAYWLGIYRSGTALWKERIVANAKRYDHIIRSTAYSIGYLEHTEIADSR